MDFRQLRNFVTIADCQSFKSAASVLNVSQPTLSVSIKTLEREMGADLFVRTRKKIELTELGDKVLIYARSALREMEKARALTPGLNNQPTRTIRFGINSALAHALNKHVIPQFIETHANIKLEIDVATIPQSLAVERVTSGRWDFGVVLGNIRKDDQKDVTVRHCVTLNSGPHTRKSHPLADKRIVSIEDLSKYDWIMSTMLKDPHVPSMISRAGFKRPTLIAQINSFDALMSLLEMRDVLTILPSEIIKHFQENRFVRLNTKELQFKTEVNLVWPQGKEIAASMRGLLDDIAAFLEGIH